VDAVASGAPAHDHEVQAGTVIKPLQGRSALGPGDAAVIAPKMNKRHGVAVSNGMAIRYGDIDPYWMAASAIDEALRGIVAVGGDPGHTAILDNFCWGNPTNPRRLGDLVRASRACCDVAAVLGTPFISGKDSFHNEFSTGDGKSIAVPPTLLISAVGRVNDISKCVTTDFKEPGNPVYVVGMTHDELGGSQYYQVRGAMGNNVPRVDADLAKDTFNKMASAIRRGAVRACHDCSDGGIAVAVAEMAFGGETGVSVTVSKIPTAPGIKRLDNILFSESNTRFIVEVDKNKQKLFEQIMQKIPCAQIGEVTADDTVAFLGKGKKPVIKATWEKLRTAWREPLLW